MDTSKHLTFNLQSCHSQPNMNRLGPKGLNSQRKIVQTIEMSHHNRQRFTVEILASLIAQLQGDLINGTNKLSFLSVQYSFLYEHLPRDLKHLTDAPPV